MINCSWSFQSAVTVHIQGDLLIEHRLFFAWCNAGLRVFSYFISLRYFRRVRVFLFSTLWNINELFSLLQTAIPTRFEAIQSTSLVSCSFEKSQLRCTASLAFGDSGRPTVVQRKCSKKRKSFSIIKRDMIDLLDEPIISRVVRKRAMTMLAAERTFCRFSAHWAHTTFSCFIDCLSSTRRTVNVNWATSTTTTDALHCDGIYVASAWICAVTPDGRIREHSRPSDTKRPEWTDAINTEETDEIQDGHWWWKRSGHLSNDSTITSNDQNHFQPLESIEKRNHDN